MSQTAAKSLVKMEQDGEVVIKWCKNEREVPVQRKEKKKAPKTSPKKHKAKRLSSKKVSKKPKGISSQKVSKQSKGISSKNVSKRKSKKSPKDNRWGSFKLFDITNLFD